LTFSGKKVNIYKRVDGMDVFEAIKSHYNSRDEDARLSSKHGQIEYLTTMHYIKKYLKPGMKILEIGAGTGKYSHTLALKGHEVYAVELVQHNIDIFNEKTEPTENIKIFQGNAIDLNFLENETFDITLVLGPMYHLFTSENQKKAFSEALKVTKTNGILFFAYCIMDATLITYGFQRGNILKVIEKGLLNTETFRAFSTPEEIFQLYRKEDIDCLISNFNVVRLHYVATDLYTNYIPETIDLMDEQTYELYLNYHLKMCERMDMVGITHHSLDIVKKI
jgi:2-polyprenyl-3-methyl-5-hydroxy-6-metoxy-1,4-benzoquinol methylase